MEDLLKVLINAKRGKLNFLVANKPNLQDKDIIRCSMELDMLISEYLSIRLKKQILTA